MKSKGGKKLMCRKCRDIIQSLSVHHMVYCKCGAIMVDGGAEYTRCGGNSLDDILNLDGTPYIKPPVAADKAEKEKA